MVPTFHRERLQGPKRKGENLHHAHPHQPGWQMAPHTTTQADEFRAFIHQAPQAFLPQPRSLEAPTKIFRRYISKRPTRPPRVTLLP
ncbi:hypothetical protein CCUS01_03196 [Colletotrichum cuscutae]|uniref:Uncharacterized protein n=1 Tax=Colletotrichum cuscutae TaxID=1209917 RepID=A0AAI9Y9P3_9PEZI|nr:hypothetical protein CCUS01_03196 [Colletotrichum cuscutae]